MKRETGYNTKQKEKLLEFLIANKDKHTNVQEISAYFSAEGTPLGTTTIYRQLDCDHLLSLNKHIAEHHGFIIDPCQTVFYGRCADCLKLEPHPHSHCCGE